MTDDEGLMQVHLAAWCQHIPIRSMTSIIISSLLIESKVHQMWCAFRPNDCRLHIAKHGLLHFSEKAFLSLISLWRVDIFFPISTLEFTFSPQHFLEKKETQQQKLGRRKFAQCPFAVIFITFKKDDWCRNNIGGEEEGGILRWQKKYDVAIFSHFRCCLLKPFRFMAELAWPM